MKEEDFVKYLKDNFSYSGNFGIGDDCSVRKIGDIYQFISNDVLVEDVHFTKKHFNFEEIALRSLAVNISDIAAMGGVAKEIYLGLAWPKEYKEKELRQFYQGIKKGCEKWNIELAGGDYTSADKIFISVTVLGEGDKVVLREGATEGNNIFLTSSLGQSSLGLFCLNNNFFEEGKDFIQAHKLPNPQTENASFLKDKASAMLDISDGFIKDLSRLCTASSCAVFIDVDKIPIDKSLIEFCNNKKLDVYEFVLGGGEDFALLFSAPDDYTQILLNKGYYKIGKVINNKTTTFQLFKNGVKFQYNKTIGYDHFKT